MMKNQVHRIAALLAAAALLSSSAMAAGEVHLIDNGPSPDGGASVAYATCDEDEGCIATQFGCSTDTGWVELIDGQAIAGRLLGQSLPSMTFRVGAQAIESRIWDVHNQADEMSGGWDVKIEGGDMAQVFRAITKQPDASVTVDIAGQQAYDLTPAKADRATLSKMADTCLRAMASSALDTVEPASLGL